jgi:predicted GH43/DUF377 family glycosyl hydrolase
MHVKKEGIVLEPTENNFENHGVYNPAVVLYQGKIHLFYRATNKANYSTIGHCVFKTPTELESRSETPVIIPVEKYEAQGVEDPRIVNIDDTFFMTYTAYDGKNAMGALTVSRDLKTFESKGLITPLMTYKEFQLCIESCKGLNIKYLRFARLFHKRSGAESVFNMNLWDKDVVLFPRKLNGKFAMLHRIYPDIQIAYFSDIQELNYSYWKKYLIDLKNHIVLTGKMPFESSYVGSGCPPVETSEGWLLIYHGVADTPNGYVYAAGAALLSLDDPTKEIGRLKEPLFYPEMEWEQVGVTHNVVFPTGAIAMDNTLYIYYGAADKRIGLVSVNLNDLLNELKQQGNGIN